jgi:GAF domain-containing protein/CheY-like chemotaxis protein
VKKILIIEADAVARRIAGETLRKEHEIIEAADGQRGLKEIRETPSLAAVVLAADLPGLTGMDTLIAIRKFRGALPVILMMDKPAEDHKMLALRRGASDILLKPVRPDELLMAVSRAATASRLSGRLDRQIRRLQMLEKSALELTSMHLADLAPEEVIREDVFLKKTIDLVGEVLDARKVSLMLVDEERRELMMAHSNWMTTAQMASVRQPLATGVAGWVVREGKPIMVADVAADPRFAKAGHRGQYDSPAFLCTPLFFKRKVVGTISANDRADGEPFSDSDLSVLNTFAHQISMAIANISTYRRLQRELAKIEAVNGMVNAALGSIEPEEIFSNIASRAREFLAAEAAAIFSLNEAEEMVLEGFIGPQPLDSERSARIAGGTVSRALKGESLLVSEAARTKGIEAGRDFPPGVAPVSLAAVPLTVKGKVLGVLAVYNHLDGRPLGPFDLEVLEAMAPHASMAIKNAWLYQNLLSSIDEVVAANTRLESAREEISAKTREISQLKKRISP